MFTKNWYIALVRGMSDSLNTHYATYNGGTYDGNVTSVPRLDSGSSSGTNTSLKFLQTTLGKSAGVYLGTGTTPPTLNDYCLSGDIISQFTYSSDVQRTTDENGVTYTALYTITNTGDSAFTIGELGLIGCCCTAYNSYTSAGYQVLYERTVLDSPLTIGAGSIGQLTYTVRFNYPTA